MSQTSEAGVATPATTNTITAATVAHSTDDPRGCAFGHSGCPGHPEVRRLPCRSKGCTGTRPATAIGAAYLFDRCARCAGRVIKTAAMGAAA